MTNDEIQNIKQALAEEKKNLLLQIEEHSKVVKFGDDSDAIESEEADETEEFANNLAIAQALKERLEEIEEAVNRMNAGKYGVCISCGGQIPDEALKKIPTTVLCPDHL